MTKDERDVLDMLVEDWLATVHCCSASLCIEPATWWNTNTSALPVYACDDPEHRTQVGYPMPWRPIESSQLTRIRLVQRFRSAR